MKFYLGLLFFLVSTAQASTQFIIVGDTGKDNKGQRQVADAMIQHCQKEPCHYGLLAGDNVYQEGVTSETDPILHVVFRKYYEPLKIPFYVTLGNHDYGRWSNNWSRGQYQLQYATQNPQFVLPHFFYYQEFDHLVLAVIDTSRLLWGVDVAAQQTMIQEAYRKSTGKWFIVMGHHPYLSNGKHGNAGRYEGIALPAVISGTQVKKFLDRYVCEKAQLYISGHDHNLQYLDGRQANCKTDLLISGAGASTTALKDKNQAAFASEELGYASLEVTAERLNIRFFNQLNTLLFESQIKK